MFRRIGRNTGRRKAYLEEKKDGGRQRNAADARYLQKPVPGGPGAAPVTVGYSRTAIVVMLVAAEILVLGAVFWALGGRTGFTAGAVDLRPVAFHPKAIAPIDAGNAPHVTVSDADSLVTVTPSGDGRVHVTDLTHFGGAMWGTGRVAQLSVERTSGGVRIERPESGGWANGFIDLGGFARRRIAVALPAGASLDVRRAAGADIAGLSGPVRVVSLDGRIVLRDLSGGVDARSDDGAIEASGVSGASVSLASQDGRISLVDVSTGTLVATTADGSIHASGLRIGGPGATGRLHTGDGSVDLSFAGDPNLSVRAHTGDGRILMDGRTTHNDDATDARYTLGSGAGSFDVSTQDGTISMTTNGGQ